MKDRQALKLKIKKQLVWYSFIFVSIITLIVLTYIPVCFPAYIAFFYRF